MLECVTFRDVAMIFFGALLSIMSIPAWFAGVFLPHPLVGAWIAIYGVYSAVNRWKGNRSLAVEVHELGLRFLRRNGSYDVFWGDIDDYVDNRRVLDDSYEVRSHQLSRLALRRRPD